MVRSKRPTPRSWSPWTDTQARRRVLSASASGAFRAQATVRLTAASRRAETSEPACEQLLDQPGAPFTVRVGRSVPYCRDEDCRHHRTARSLFRCSHRSCGHSPAYTAEDDIWYQPPYDGDAGDDDGYFLAVVRLLPYAIPLLGVAYIAGALVARTRHPAGP